MPPMSLGAPETPVTGASFCGGTPVVLHLADHDPNGIDMTRDVIERLARYARADIEVRRIALNMPQVRQ